MTGDLSTRLKLQQQRARAAAARQPQADMSFMGRLRDNVVGVEDGVNSLGERVGSFINRGVEAATMGAVGDEANAAADVMMGRGDYDQRLAVRRGQEQQFAEQHPVANMVATIGGAVVGPGKFAAPVTGLRGAAAAAAGSSAIEGFAEGEGGLEDRALEATKSATTGLFFGGLAAGLGKGASVGLRKVFDRAEKRPTLEALREAKNSAYAAVRRSGVAFSGDDMGAFSRRIARLAKTARWDIDEDFDEGAVRVMRALQRRADAPMSLNNLDKMRQRFWDIYRRSDEPFVLEAISEIDKLIEQKAAGNEVMKAARAANSKFAKAQLLENAFKKARLQTQSTGSGGNILNKYRQAITRIVTTEREARWFSPEELAVMESFIDGDNMENTLRRVGKLAPGGNGLMTALNVYAAAIDPTMLAVTATGTAAKSAADRSALKGSERILDAVSTGVIAPPRPAVPVGQPAVAAGAAANEWLR